MREFQEPGGGRVDLVLSMGAYEVEGTEPDIETMIGPGGDSAKDGQGPSYRPLRLL